VSDIEYRVISGISSLRTDEEAAKVGAVLEKRFGDGPIDAAALVRLAAPTRSPLHRYFEWDDAIAASEYRLEQAKSIMRSIAVVRVDASGNERTLRAFHSVALLTVEGAERAYMPERIVWATPELADQVVVRAQRELIGWQDRYSTYESLRAAVGLVGAAVETLADRAS